MKLYSFFRSGTSHRLRIALRLKGLPVDYVAVDLRTEQLLDSADKTLNPQGLVPALVLVLPDARVLTQTPAIIEWLEERHPTPSSLPTGSIARARVRALAGLVACDLHPLNNRRVLEYLRHHVHYDELAINAWCGTWIGAGFDPFETVLAANTHRSAFLLGRCTDAGRRLPDTAG